MPASAFALLGVFILLAIAVGIAAAWIIGPRLRVAVVLPVLAAFGALYWLGHRSGLELGPTITLFGFQVAIVQDVLAAVVAAGAAVLIQRAGWTRRRVRHAASADAPRPGA
ncbi:MAG: hypothetical protein LH650_06745 [Chloroflexi bacterium]|nr:hypothetical protein [Chloroflexota bacterium]